MTESVSHTVAMLGRGKRWHPKTAAVNRARAEQERVIADAEALAEEAEIDRRAAIIAAIIQRNPS